MPNQTEIATNKAVLDSVDTKMATLDAAIAWLDDLVARRAALTDSVADLRKQETGYLRNDGTNEDDAVQSLIQLRVRIDVQSARVASLDSQIEEQQATVVSVGTDAGNCQAKEQHLSTGKTPTGLVEDQVTTAARIHRLRLH
jgi:hypothetical protein